MVIGNARVNNMSDEENEGVGSFIDNSSLNLLIKVTSSLVVLLSILIISLWAVYQTADVTFGGRLFSGTMGR